MNTNICDIGLATGAARALPWRTAAYTLDAVIDAGMDPTLARTLLADGPRAVPERARLSLYGRGRTPMPIREYVWGPDAAVLLADCRTGGAVRCR